MATSTCVEPCTCHRTSDDRGSVSRRGVLAGSAAAAAALALGSCAASDEASSPSSSPEPANETPTPEESPTAGGGSGEVLVGTDEFPVGGGAVVQASSGPVVVTHPDDDVYVAFTGVCTHQGCTVAEVLENTISCHCHGSTFDGSSGEVLGGPATSALAPIAVQVSDGEISLA